MEDFEKYYLEATLKNLQHYFEENVKEQLQHPEQFFQEIDVEDGQEPDMRIGCDDIDTEGFQLQDILAWFTNCCFLPSTGEEVFPGTLTDGKPHLMMHITLMEVADEEEIKRLIASSIYPKLTHFIITFHKGVANHHFYIDCGEDAAEMTSICKAIMTEVYDMHFINQWLFNDGNVGNKDFHKARLVETLKGINDRLQLEKFERIQ